MSKGRLSAGVRDDGVRTGGVWVRKEEYRADACHPGSEMLAFEPRAAAAGLLRCSVHGTGAAGGRKAYVGQFPAREKRGEGGKVSMSVA